MASRFGGNDHGVYHCNRHQMITKIPHNVGDEELSRGIWSEDHPSHHATEVSYSLQRIRLAEIARRAVDRSPYGATTVGTSDYANVAAADAELSQFMEDLPSFLKLDNIDRVLDSRS